MRLLRRARGPGLSRTAIAVTMPRPQRRGFVIHLAVRQIFNLFLDRYQLVLLSTKMQSLCPAAGLSLLAPYQKGRSKISSGLASRVSVGRRFFQSIGHDLPVIGQAEPLILGLSIDRCRCALMAVLYQLPVLGNFLGRH